MVNLTSFSLLKTLLWSSPFVICTNGNANYIFVILSHSLLFKLTQLWWLLLLIKSPLFVSHLRRRVRWQCTFSTGPGTCQERPDCASAHSRLRSPAGPENAPSPCSHAQTDPRQRTSDTHLGATTLYLQRAKTGTSLEFDKTDDLMRGG